MNFQSIRFKYTAAFLAVALIMAFSGIYSYILISNLSKASNEFSHKFNPAISAILNADRDLYQARVAELTALLDPSEIESNRDSYEENAQQAYDRMYVYLDLLANYPAILAKLEGFDATYDQWKDRSSQVFSLLEQGKTEEAKSLSEGDSNSTFSTLRDVYDLAGAEADETGLALGDSVVSYVSSRSTRVSILLFLTVIAAAALGIFAPRAMSQSLKILTTELGALNSGDGDLSRRIRSSRKDEIGDVANEIDLLFDGLTKLIRGIVSQSGVVLENAVAMNDGAESVRHTSQAQ
jgi:methyl-accepting chemotaxis protein